MKKDDAVDWQSIVEQRLAEARRSRLAEQQADQPPPGPEAAEKLVERIRAATGAGAGAEPPPDPQDVPAAADGFAEPSDPAGGSRSDETSANAMNPVPRGHRHHHRLSRRNLKRNFFYLVLAVLFIAGILMIFWPEWRKLWHFVGPGEESFVGGEVILDDKKKKPAEPAGKQPDPAPPAGTTGAPSEPKPLPEKAPPPEIRPAGPTSAPKPEPLKAPPETRREPFLKRPPEGPVPAGPKPRPPEPPDAGETPNPFKLPEPPQPPAEPKPPKPLWDKDGKGETRPVEPQQSLG